MAETEHAERHAQLTRAEREITPPRSEGLSVQEIAEIRSVSIATVRGQLRAVYRKTAVHNTGQLARWVSQHRSCCIELPWETSQ